jgi:RNA-directed DNA polymerase
LPDSYGYRPGKSALDAIGVTRKRCWKYEWVLEFDIKLDFGHLASIASSVYQAVDICGGRF